MLFKLSIINLFFIIHSSSAHLLSLYINKDTCSSLNNASQCLDNNECIWCNNSFPDVNYGCSSIIPCDFLLNSDKYKNCTINHQKHYMLECQIMYSLFYFLILISFYISLLFIFGKVNKIMLTTNMTQTKRKMIIGIMFVLILTPLVTIFIIYPLAFYFMYISYIVAALVIHCCCNTSDINQRGEYTPALINQTVNKPHSRSMYQKINS